MFHMQEPGDLIEIDRGTFQHWAVYVGDGYIIHATTNETSSSAAIMSGKATVRKDKLKDVAAGDTWRVKNSLDKDYTPRSPDVILKEAEEMVGKQIPYSLLGKNCEDFATNLRYGVPKSRQAQEAIEAMVLSGASVPIGVMMAFKASQPNLR
ncbi:phospholipase A and acyltransferase 3-like [Alosa pseudoharengus]|uniref:phospholipase A and acyltransferase 3-like n=1 Tax=Alosa pseudoharengus TaxID=34774 RepID=UPI003F892F13